MVLPSYLMCYLTRVRSWLARGAGPDAVKLQASDFADAMLPTCTPSCLVTNRTASFSVVVMIFRSNNFRCVGTFLRSSTHLTSHTQQASGYSPKCKPSCAVVVKSAPIPALVTYCLR